MCRVRLPAMCALIVLFGSGSVAVSKERPDLSANTREPDPITLASLRKGLDSVASFLRTVGTELDRSAYDVDSLLESLNYDPEEIVQFVQSSISFEPYPGVLRGVAGTLFSRAGNSADQSLLLAKLLKDAGYDARIARGTLSLEEARDVVKVLSEQNDPPNAFKDLNRIDHVLGPYDFVNYEGRDNQGRNVLVGARPDSADTRSDYTLAKNTADLLVSRIRARGIELGTPDLDDSILEEARDYYWVEYKESTSSPWAPVHPIFTDLPPFEAPRASTYFSDEIPAELQHRLRFQVFIEQKAGDSFQIRPITSAWERPIANMVGIPFTYENVADSMLRRDAAAISLEEHADIATSFLPSFNGEMAPGGQFFDLSGTLIDPIAARDSAAGLFATVNDAFESAIGSIGNESDLPILTAQWLEFTLIAPGGKETVFRRSTLDRIGAANRGDPDSEFRLGPAAVRRLLRRHTFMVSTGPVPLGYVIESGIRRFELSRPGIEALYELRAGRNVEPERLSRISTGWDGHLPLYTLFDVIRNTEPSTRSYRSGPALVIHSDGLGDSETRLETLDIVTNPSRTFVIEGELPKLDAERNLLPGVWETLVEARILASNRSFNTWTALGAAEESGVELVALVAGGELNRIKASPDTLAAVARDLESGYAVVIPKEELQAGASGWWRINPETGESLGQFGDGRGGELAEFAITLTITLGAFTYGVHQCATGYEGVTEYCCQVANAGLALTTFGIGSVVALKAQTAGAGLFNIAVGGYMDLAGTLVPTGGACAAIFD